MFRILITDSGMRATVPDNYFQIANYHNTFAADVIHAVVSLAKADRNADRRRDRG